MPAEPACHKCELREIQKFYRTYYSLSSKKYTSGNFNDSLNDEKLTGYVCGSDTIFAVPEFGFDDGYYANYDAMKGRSVAYAASFGDYDIPEDSLSLLRDRLDNFNSIALRENDKIPLVRSLYGKPLYKVVDPTLLLSPEDYDPITETPANDRPYLLLYSRRRNVQMDEFAEKYASDHGLEIVEISLNAMNADRHTMRYDAGVEEFLGLVKNASMVVTNSFHGMIFAVQFRRPFYIFSRKLCDIKIAEMLDQFGIDGRLINSSVTQEAPEIDYDRVHERIADLRKESLDILRQELTTVL